MNKTALVLIAIVAMTLAFPAAGREDPGAQTENPVGPFALAAPILEPAGSFVPQQLDYFERVIRFGAGGFPTGLAGYGLESYSQITGGAPGWSRASVEDSPPEWYPPSAEGSLPDLWYAYAYEYDERSRLFAIVAGEFNTVYSIAFEVRTSDQQLMESLARYLIQRLERYDPVTVDQGDDRIHVVYAGPGGDAIANDPITFDIFMNDSFIVLTLKALI